jgi:hypothetical protein
VSRRLLCRVHWGSIDAIYSLLQNALFEWSSRQDSIRLRFHSIYWTEIDYPIEIEIEPQPISSEPPARRSDPIVIESQVATTDHRELNPVRMVILILASNSRPGRSPTLQRDNQPSITIESQLQARQKPSLHCIALGAQFASNGRLGVEFALTQWTMDKKSRPGRIARPSLCQMKDMKDAMA